MPQTKHQPQVVRVATFNTALFREESGGLQHDLATGNDAQAHAVAEIIQRARPHVLLINEFDYDPALRAADLFQALYLDRPHEDAAPISYPYRFCAPSNTGLDSGLDLDGDGLLGGPGDAFGYGLFPGQYAMLLLSQLPIETAAVRTFQQFLWRDMPGARMPDSYPPQAQTILRLSSKSHWDVPLQTAAGIVHLLAAHPTPPGVGAMDERLQRRNYDEIRFWADYIDPARSAYCLDDQGRRGGLSESAHFIIAGDMNADPHDGGSWPGAARQLTEHPLVNQAPVPTSPGGAEQAALQGLANSLHKGDPAHDTADFSDGTADDYHTAPGNLRVDYVLPSKTLKIRDAGVFWPLSTDPLFRLTGVYPFPSSDHRLVWVDVAL